MILLRSFLSGHIRIKRTLEYYDAGIGPRVPFGGGFGPTVSANFAVALGDFTTLSSTSTMPTGGSISRAGNAMLYDSTGKLTYAPNNLALYNADFSNGVWSSYYASKVGPYAGTDPAGTNTAYEIGLDGGGGGGSATLVYQTFTAVTGVRYMASFYVRAKTGTTSVRVRFFDGSVNDYSSNITVDSTGWTRVYYAYTSTASSASAFFGINTNSTANTTNVYVAFAQLEAVTYQTSPSGTYYLNYPTPNTTAAYYGPRFDYDPVTLAAKGLLVEGQRVNALLYSQDFTQTDWTKTNLNTTGSPAWTNVAVAPDGTTTAEKLIANTTNGLHTLRQDITASNVAYTFSIYLKSSEYVSATIQMSDNSTGDVGAIVNLAGGTIVNRGFAAGSWTNISFTLTAIGNGWYRATLTATKGAGTQILTFVRVRNATDASSNGAESYAGNDTSGLFAWGAQLEAASFATSYIPTVASSVARAAETFSLTGYANRLVEAYYIDEETGGSYSGNSALSTGTVTISPPTFGWVTSLRAYTNAYAGSISTPSWLSFSRAGNAMYYDSTGTLTYAPNNLVLWSQDFRNTAAAGSSRPWGWGGSTTVTSNVSGVPAPDGTETASRVSGFSTSDGDIGLSQSVTVSPVKLIGSIYVRGEGSDIGKKVLLRAKRIGGTLVTTDAEITLTAGWQRLSVNHTMLSDNTGVQLILSGAAASNQASSCLVWGSQLEPVTYQTAPSAYIPTTSAAVYGPRYDYDPSTVPATPRGLLIEESRQNLLLQSQTFNTSWTLNNILAFGSGSIADAITAPDGTTTADKIVENTSTTSHFVNQTATVTNGASYTYSVFAKAGERKYLTIFCINTAAAANTFFNLSNGTVVSTSSGATSSITSVGNGWYRCSVTTTTTSTTSGIYPGISPDGVNASYTGDGVSGVYLWGAQLEAGAFATSYIPTTTASVTRAADVAQLTGSALTITTSNPATAAVEYLLPNNQASRRILWANELSSGNYTNNVRLTSDNVGLVAATVDKTKAIAYTSGQINRLIMGWGGAGWSAYQNAGTLQTDTSAMPTGLTVTRLGSHNDGVYMNGYVRSMALYNTRLPDAILKQKSSVGAPY